jgi:hypothetical protein
MQAGNKKLGFASAAGLKGADQLRLAMLLLPQAGFAIEACPQGSIPCPGLLSIVAFVLLPTLVLIYAAVKAVRLVTRPPLRYLASLLFVAVWSGAIASYFSAAAMTSAECAQHCWLRALVSAPQR